MSASRPPAPGTAPAAPASSLSRQMDRIRRELAERHHFGLLYVTVLRRSAVAPQADWQAYDAMLHATHQLLGDFHRNRLRRSDVFLGPVSNGNAFVLLLDAPRRGGELDPTHLGRVRSRLQRSLTLLLRRNAPPDARERFGCYVGGAVLRHDPAVGAERIVYRALEEAFADAMQAQEREDRRDAAQLRRILRTGRVRAVYQPVVDIVARRIVGYEALTRVADARFETPDLLFRIAQRHDSLWNLERLCRQRALDDLPSLGEDQLLFLNTEPQSIADPALRDAAFLQRIEAAGVRASQIVLEITEHSVVHDFVEFRRHLQEFRSRGFRLAMDDVGSGYAGLQAIAEIAPDFIKVDMTLIRDMHVNSLKRELLSTIRRFSERTGITVIAEGVECVEELRSLAATGVRCAQGFLFARPDAPPRIPDWSMLPPSR